MTSTISAAPVDHRARTNIERPPLETVDPNHTDPTQFGALSDDPDNDLDVAAHLERGFLATLIWSPQQEASSVINCLANIDHSALFWQPAHDRIYRTIAELHLDGTPATIRTLGAMLATDPSTRHAMLDIAAPTGGINPSWPELRHLATALVDAWYRRGYFAMLTRMRQICTELTADQYAHWWTNLTSYQIAAEHTRASILAALDAPSHLEEK